MARRGGNRQTQPFTEADLNALFFAQTEQRGVCLEWTGFRTPSGYGNVTRKGRSQRAHRVAWEIANGPIPVGKVVRHVVCANPPCVLVGHLALGEPVDNSRDMVRAGRQARLGRPRFSDEDIQAVVGLVGLGWAQKQAASLFGMDPSHVSRLVRGHSGRVVAGHRP